MIATPFIVKKRFAHDRAKVFAAFSNAAALAQWFAPNADVKMTVYSFQFAVGGRYHFGFVLPDGTATSLAGEYQLIQVPVQIRFTWCWQEPDPHEGIDTVVNADFRTVPNVEAPCTDVIISHERLAGALLRTRHAEGWRASLQRLYGLLAGSTASTPMRAPAPKPGNLKT